MNSGRTDQHSKEENSYLQKRNIQLYQWQRVLDRLISRAVKAEGKSRRDQHHHIIKIQIKKDRTEVNLKQLSKADSKMWGSIKIAVEKSWKELRQAFLKASKEKNE